MRNGYGKRRLKTIYIELETRKGFGERIHIQPQGSIKMGSTANDVTHKHTSAKLPKRQRDRGVQGVVHK